MLATPFGFFWLVTERLYSDLVVLQTETSFTLLQSCNFLPVSCFGNLHYSTMVPCWAAWVTPPTEEREAVETLHCTDVE